MNNGKLTNRNIGVMLYDGLQMRNICLGNANKENSAKFVCRQTFAIWNKHNGLEWDQELIWDNNINKRMNKQSTYITAMSSRHSLMLEIEEYFHTNLFFRKITIHNNAKIEQDLRLFFQQDFDYSGTTFFSLGDRNLYHESQGRCILFNGVIDNKGISQYTTVQKDDLSVRNVLDVENGRLNFNPISTGKVKSAFSLEAKMLPYEIKHGFYWVAFGATIKEVNLLNNIIKNDPDWLISDFIENELIYKIKPMKQIRVE
ncbi:hypothetical protein [Calidifontibacillus oryziterrae]|uniref:hypothetical protein n=1 Tax=Calidifontibacillus oryziterrae TaxID=1191699 RepID=UPI0002DFB000|nr:hypothetical protein [Calidifontibacillus oryziterrae]